MSSIIQKVTYEKEAARPLEEKFGELLGVHRLIINLSDGSVVEGIVSEVGKDYIVLIEGKYDIIIPTSRIMYFRYDR